MKIMSFNIQHGAIFEDPERKIDLRAFADYINAEKPDILGLNEVRGLGDGIPEPESINADRASQAKILASLTDMNYFFAPAIGDEKSLYGNALLTRFDIEKSEIFPIPSPDESLRLYHRNYENRCLLKSVLKVSGERMTVFVCHMGLNPDERLSAVQIICRELDRTEGKKILMGDFNMTPDNELLIPIYDRLSDTAVKIKGNMLTFPSDAPEIKIDYIFVSNDTDIRSAIIPEKYVSDHRVHIAEI
ncbi:MAG: endonuclease/exonuclease/phosphatase family protein [Clostridia bacterium]|nr:endonuclease/exonuclease/phosphatase family protein [Clostridia bacterium]